MDLNHGSGKDVSYSFYDNIKNISVHGVLNTIYGGTKHREVADAGASIPVKGPITSRFGYRIHPVYKNRRLHTGVDIGSQQGSPIYSIKAGKVVFSGTAGGYGYLVEVDHGGGMVTRYAHCSKLLKKVGDKVTQYEMIALSGGARGTAGAGTSTGPHLHFEVRINGSPVDPMPYLKR